MAFIRSYGSRADRNLDVGDPFSFRIPKKLRKWKPGKSLGAIARAGLSFIPGAGALAGLGGIAQRLAPIAAKYGVPLSQVQGFARAYGYDVGDPASGTTKRRKNAATGTKAKSKAKQERRAARAGKPKGKARRPSGSKSGVDWGKLAEASTSLLPIGADLAKEAMHQFGGGGATDDAIAADIGAALGGGKGMRLPGMGGHRRHMNPGNVKALRRSIRRVEGFERLVKSVQKAYPRLRQQGHRACSCSSKKRGR